MKEKRKAYKIISDWRNNKLETLGKKICKLNYNLISVVFLDFFERERKVRKLRGEFVRSWKELEEGKEYDQTSLYEKKFR